MGADWPLAADASILARLCAFVTASQSLTGEQGWFGTAKFHSRRNGGHAYTVFRVRMDALKPRTTYYYKVDSMGDNGDPDGVQSPVRRFTTQ
jgi:hypothetical protein